jgi:RNAse (barnase) inhibitor barstar
MPLDALNDLLESEKGGVFYLPQHAAPRDIQAAATRAKFAFFHIEGKNIARKEQLLNHVATALRFPGYFGENWDALEECLTDMEWVDAPGYMIYFDHIDGLLTAHPDQFETFVEICRDAVRSWKEDGTPMVVLLSGAKVPKGVTRLKESDA